MYTINAYEPFNHFQQYQFQVDYPAAEVIVSKRKKRVIKPKAPLLGNVCTTSIRVPQVHKQLVQVVGAQGKVQELVQRLPTPVPDCIEKTILETPGQDTINLIYERPVTPPPQIIEKRIIEAPPPPIVNCFERRVPHRPRTNCSTHAAASAATCACNACPVCATVAPVQEFTTTTALPTYSAAIQTTTTTLPTTSTTILQSRAPVTSTTILPSASMTILHAPATSIIQTGTLPRSCKRLPRISMSTTETFHSRVYIEPKSVVFQRCASFIDYPRCSTTFLSSRNCI
jgi:hypothetical protein